MGCPHFVGVPALRVVWVWVFDLRVGPCGLSVGFRCVFWFWVLVGLHCCGDVVLMVVRGGGVSCGFWV